MENNEERIDRYFKERLAAFESSPGETVWKEIEVKLGNERRKGMFYMVIRIAAGMTLLTSLGLGVYFATKNNVSKQIVQSISDPYQKTEIQKSQGKVDNREPAPANPVRVKANESPADKPSVSPAVITEVSVIPKTETIAMLKGKEISLFPVFIRAELKEPLKSPAEPVLLNTEEEYIASTDDFITESDEVKKHQWFLGSEVAPLYSYRTIASDDLDQGTLNELNKNETGMLAYAAGLNVAFATGKRLSIQSGLYYSRYGQEKNNVEAYSYQYEDIQITPASSDILTIPNSTGTINHGQTQKTGYDYTNVVGNSTDVTVYPTLSVKLAPTEVHDITVSQYFDYLEVPVTMKYKLINRKLDFSLLGGVVTNFLVGNSVILNQDGEPKSIGKTSGINKVNYLGSVGLGVEFPIMSRLSFSFEPRFRYYINPIDNSSQINVHPYSFGVFAGLSYLFR